MQLIRPDGTAAVDDTSPDGVGAGHHGQTAFDFHERVRFDVPGTWRLRYSLGGNVLVDASVRVVARAAQIRNRPPSGVTATVVVSPGVAQCVVGTMLAYRDPDFDVVRYRYRWSVGGTNLRKVTSAALSDVVPVKAGQRVRCASTPNDGNVDGVPAVAFGQVPGAR